MADMRSQNKGLLAVLRGQKGWLSVWLVEVGWLSVLMVEEGLVGWPKDRGWLHQFPRMLMVQFINSCQLATSDNFAFARKMILQPLFIMYLYFDYISCK